MAFAALQIASHLPFILSASYNLYRRRLVPFTAMCGTITASLMYHSCLGYNACYNPLDDLGAADYVISGMTGTVYIIQMAHFRRQLSVAFLILSFVTSVILYPRIYGSFGAGLMGPIVLAIYQVSRIVVYGLPPAFSNKWLTGAILAFSTLAFIALTYPAQVGTTLYDPIHCVWHVLAGCTFLAYDLLFDHYNTKLEHACDQCGSPLAKEPDDE